MLHLSFLCHPYILSSFLENFYSFLVFTWVILLSWLMTPVTSFINKAKMAVSVTTVWMFVHFGLVWLKLRQNRHSKLSNLLTSLSSSCCPPCNWVLLDAESSRWIGDTVALPPITAWKSLKNGKLSSPSDSLPVPLFRSLSTISLYLFFKALIFARHCCIVR